MSIHRDKDTLVTLMELETHALRMAAQHKNLVDFYEEMADNLGGLFFYERLDAYLPDRRTAKSSKPEDKALATAEKVKVVAQADRLEDKTEERGRELVALLQPLLGNGVSLVSSQEVEISFASMFLKDDGTGAWDIKHPIGVEHLLSNGWKMQVFHIGSVGMEGPCIRVFNDKGNEMTRISFRQSGTEAMVRLYLDIKEPVDQPNPHNLISYFAPLIQYLGLDRYRLDWEIPAKNGKEALPAEPNYFVKHATITEGKYPRQPDLIGKASLPIAANEFAERMAAKLGTSVLGIYVEDGAVGVEFGNDHRATGWVIFREKSGNPVYGSDAQTTNVAQTVLNEITNPPVKYQEMLDVVDENNHVIGQIAKDDAHKTGAQHRGVTIFLVDPRNGTVVFQRRAPNKKTFANRWDVSVAGHVKAASHYGPTAREELREEAPIEIDASRLIQVKEEGFFRADVQDPAIGHNRELKTIYIALLTPVEIDQLLAHNAELEGFWQGYTTQPGGKFTARQEALIMQKAAQLASKSLQGLDPTTRQKFIADAEAYFEVAGYRFISLDQAVAEYEQAPSNFADGFFSLFGTAYPNGTSNPNAAHYTMLLKEALDQAIEHGTARPDNPVGTATGGLFGTPFAAIYQKLQAWGLPLWIVHAIVAPILQTIVLKGLFVVLPIVATVSFTGDVTQGIVYGLFGGLIGSFVYSSYLVHPEMYMGRNADPEPPTLYNRFGLFVKDVVEVLSLTGAVFISISQQHEVFPSELYKNYSLLHMNFLNEGILYGLGINLAIYIIFNSVKLIFDEGGVGTATRKTGTDKVDHPFEHIIGVPASGFAMTGQTDDWNKVETWQNAVVSADGTKLGVASVLDNAWHAPSRTVHYIVLYDRDAKTGQLSAPKVARAPGDLGAWRLLGEVSTFVWFSPELTFTADNRLTFSAVVTAHGRAEAGNTEYTRPSVTGVYRIYQMAPLTGSVKQTSEIVAYDDIAAPFNEWTPHFSKDWKRVLMPLWRYKEKERHGMALLAEADFDLEQGKIIGEPRYLLANGDEIPGAHQPLKLDSNNTTQFNYAADGNGILLVQGGTFYRIKSSTNQKQLLPGKLVGTVLTGIIALISFIHAAIVEHTHLKFSPTQAHISQTEHVLAVAA